MNITTSSAFAGLTELASEKVNGKVLYCTDDFFAEKENLLKVPPAIFLPDEYTERGKWMDGWESRRKRVEGYDWAVIRLGIPGYVKGVDIDTAFFTGNHPPYASVWGAKLDAGADEDSLYKEKMEWTEIVPKVSLNPGSQNLFAAINNSDYFTHLRLNIFPDGGVARFRVYGDVHKGWKENYKGEQIDLAGLVNGGKVIICNDMYFGSKDNLNSPTKSMYMGDGWETKRKRIPGYDWCILKLAEAGSIKKIMVDTAHFKGNFPDTCSIEGVNLPHLEDYKVTDPMITWKEILPKVKLQADTEHFFEEEIVSSETFTHLKLNIFPDGGVSRLRIYGTI